MVRTNYHDVGRGSLRDVYKVALSKSFALDNFYYLNACFFEIDRY